MTEQTEPDYRTGPNIAVAAETLGAAIGKLSVQDRTEFGDAHREAVHAAYSRAEEIMHSLLMNLVYYGNGHGVNESGYRDKKGNPDA